MMMMMMRHCETITVRAREVSSTASLACARARTISLSLSRKRVCITHLQGDDANILFSLHCCSKLRYYGCCWHHSRIRATSDCSLAHFYDELGWLLHTHTVARTSRETDDVCQSARTHIHTYTNAQTEPCLSIFPREIGISSCPKQPALVCVFLPSTQAADAWVESVAIALFCSRLSYKY